MPQTGSENGESGREEERNPGFHSRIGGARDATDEDSRASASVSLTCRDLLSHAFVEHGGWLEVDNAIDRLYRAVGDAIESLMEEHGCCFSVVGAAFADYFAADMVIELDPERHQDGCACDCCRREDAE
ncbi:MAG: hypothetical protein ABSE79_23485 [Terriglobia bacterium]|jgi:hypothetical protein